MSARIKSFLATVGAIGIIAAALAVLVNPQWVGFESSVNNGQETATTADVIDTPTRAESRAANSAAATTTPRKNASNSPTKSAPITHVRQPVPPASAGRLQVPMPNPSAATTSDAFQITRVPNPYPFPPFSFDAINNQTRQALVNIICGAHDGTYNPISASGVIIDPRGVILTNAHVAQYFLLSSDPDVDLSCVIRAGSPAYPRWNAEVLYIPPSWVKEHASDIKESRPLGTGEYDYALLRVTSTINGQPLQPIPFMPVDTRENIAFTDDQVLAASYPAEFAGGIVTQLNLYPASSVTSIRKMMTLSGQTVDVVSLGGIIGAQSGSSGGAVANAWGRLVGIISTTSEGETTSERDLHAITLSYINRSIASESGLDLSAILRGDVARHAYVFNASIAPALRKILTDQIKDN